MLGEVTEEVSKMPCIASPMGHEASAAVAVDALSASVKHPHESALKRIKRVKKSDDDDEDGTLTLEEATSQKAALAKQVSELTLQISVYLSPKP